MGCVQFLGGSSIFPSPAGTTAYILSGTTATHKLECSKLWLWAKVCKNQLPSKVSCTLFYFISWHTIPFGYTIKYKYSWEKSHCFPFMRIQEREIPSRLIHLCCLSIATLIRVYISEVFGCSHTSKTTIFLSKTILKYLELHCVCL